MGSISCLLVAPFGVKARASSQPGSQLGPGTESRDKGVLGGQPGPFLGAGLGLGTTGMAGGSLLSPQLGRTSVSECWGPEACRHSLSLGRKAGPITGHADGSYTRHCHLPSCSVQQHRLWVQLQQPGAPHGCAHSSPAAPFNPVLARPWGQNPTGPILTLPPGLVMTLLLLHLTSLARGRAAQTGRNLPPVPGALGALGNGSHEGSGRFKRILGSCES